MRTTTALRSPDPSVLLALSPCFAAIQNASDATRWGEEAAQVFCRAVGAELGLDLRCKPRLLPCRVGAQDLVWGACHVVLSFEATGERGLLEIEEGFAAALVDKLAGGAGEPSLAGAWSDAESAALGYLTLAGLRATRAIEPLEQALAVRLLGVRGAAMAAPPMPDWPDWIGIDLDLYLGTLCGQGRLLLPTRTAFHLCAQSGRPTGPVPAGLSSATLPARVLAGSCDLDPSEFAQLCPGDALLLTGLTRDESQVLRGPAHLELPELCLAGELAGTCLTVLALDESPNQEHVMERPEPTPPPLPVHIEVQLAKVRVPLSELASLKPGYVLALDASLTDPVELRVGDRVFARAELVDLDGELGARLVQMIG